MAKRMNFLTKKCVNCNREFEKRPKEGFETWNNRKYCSHKCYITKGGFQKGNKVTLGKHWKLTEKQKQRYKKPRKEETKRKISKTKIKRIKEGKLKMPIHNVPHSKKSRLKISIANSGKHHSEETKRKQSKTRKRLIKEGKLKIWSEGLTKRTDERLKKLSDSRIGKNKGHLNYNKEFKGCFKNGENHSNWMGGISFELYISEFNKVLKEYIRARDNFTCQLCGLVQNGHKHCVHHIDYDKKNCNPDNLISLCKKCHTKTNTNRDWWLLYFINKGEEL